MTAHNFNSVVYQYIWFHSHVLTRSCERNWSPTFLWYDMGCIEDNTSNNSSFILVTSQRGIHRQTHRHTCPTILLLLHVFLAIGAYLPSCCVAAKGRIHVTEPFPSHGKGDTHYRHTDWWEGFMKYAVEMGSGAMILSRAWVCAWLRRRVWIGWLDLLTPYSHNSGLPAIQH
jgi:hypothetical protein